MVIVMPKQYIYENRITKIKESKNYETILNTKWAFGKKRTFIAMSKFYEI